MPLLSVRRWLRRHAAAAVVLVLAASGLAADSLPRAVRIIRTDYGIAHITAPDWYGAGYGQGYAFAEDDLCVLAQDIVTLSGERSRYFGPDGAATDVANGLKTTNLDSDFFYADINGSGVVEHLLAADSGPSAHSRSMVSGYAAGYDAYLAHVGGAGGLPDATCRGAAWVRPISALDVWRRLYQLSVLNTSGAYLPGVVAAAPPGSAEPSTSLTPSPSPSPGSPSAQPVTVPTTLPSASDSHVGSNAWGLGSQAARGGGALLLGNPHFPWSGPERFWEVHLTIPGQLDVEGATLAGAPGVMIGFNAHAAWSFTVSAAQAAAVYQLSLVPGDPTAYRDDTGVHRLVGREVTVGVREPDGRIGSSSRTLWSSPIGPMLTTASLPWTGTSAFTLDDPNAANLRLLDTLLGIDTSGSTGAVFSAERRWDGLPWVNTVAVDEGGHALFDDVSVIPHLTDRQVQECQTAVGVSQVVALPVLDGSTSSCLPGRDPDSVADGVFGAAELPALTRTDYVANSNDGPWLANPAQPLTGFPQITADSTAPPSLRGRLGLEMIGQRLSGTDGLPGTGFDLTDLEQVMQGDRNYTAELVLSDLVADCRLHPSAADSAGAVVDLGPACSALAAWDGRDGLTDRGAVLFHEMLAGAISAGGFFSDRYSPKQPLTTPAHLNTDNPALLRSLADAVQRLGQAGIALDADWGSVEYAVVGGQHIPIPGSDDPGVFNVVDTSLDPAAHGYPGVASGVTFLVAVEFGAQGGHGSHGPTADAILAYSQSANPDSPHAADQSRLYSGGGMVRLAFTAAQVEHDERSIEVLHL